MAGPVSNAAGRLSHSRQPSNEGPEHEPATEVAMSSMISNDMNGAPDDQLPERRIEPLLSAQHIGQVSHRSQASNEGPESEPSTELAPFELEIRDELERAAKRLVYAVVEKGIEAALKKQACTVV